MPREPRVLFLGMNNPFSVGVLRALLADGLAPCAVVLPAAAPLPGAAPIPWQRLQAPGGIALPILDGNEGLVTVATAHGVPAFALGQPTHPETLEAIRALAPDVGCVACFSLKLPPALLALPAGGILNLHPSLLPQFRGPEPLFWIFRAGLTDSGLTVHLMDEGLDTGPILRQASFELPLGVSRAGAERRLAAVGGPLMAATTRAWLAGELTAVVQEEGPPADPWPRPEDFALSPEWSAARAFHFMRGTEEWGMPYSVDALGRTWRLATALAVLSDMPATGENQTGNHVWLPFRDGLLYARLA